MKVLRLLIMSPSVAKIFFIIFVIIIPIVSFIIYIPILAIFFNIEINIYIVIYGIGIYFAYIAIMGFLCMYMSKFFIDEEDFIL